MWNILITAVNPTTALTLILCCIIMYLLFKRISYCLPPGPTGWPVFGYTACLGPDAFRQIQHLNETYGDIVSFHVMGKTIVILNSYDVIHEAATVNRSKIGRYSMVVNDLLAENSGISNYDTPRATETRRAFVRHINDFLKPYDCEDGKFHIGLPKSVINPEIDALINEISIKEGKPVDVLQLMRRTIWRIVWQFLFGKKSQLTDEQVDNILEDIASNNLENQLFQTRQLLPWFFVEIFRRIPFARHLFKVEHILKRHKAVRREIDSNTGELSNTNSLFGLLTNDAKLNLTKSEISRLSYELMAAGTDTTSLTLTWACDYLSRAPPQDPFNLSPDVIDMVHRWASVVPLALPHLVHESFEINGYCIPKSSILIYNLYAVHNTQLRRLTNKETKPKDTKQSDTPIPFSLGARACPGFRLANTLIEKVLTAINQEFIIQHFVQPPIETTNPKDQESLSPFGLTRVPYKSLYLFFTRTNGPRRTSN